MSNRALRYAASSACAAMLVSCGGSGSERAPGVPVVSAPTPTPTPVPSPTPSPSASIYTAFDALTGEQSLPIGSLGYQTDNSLPDAVPGPLQGAFYGSPSNRLSYDGTTKTYNPGSANSFGPADLVSNDNNEQAYRKVLQGQSYAFSVVAPDAGYRLRYARVGVFRSPLPPSYNQQSTYYSFFGVPTRSTDVPMANANPFPASSAVMGDAFRQIDGKFARYSLTGSTASLVLDAVTGIATVRVTLKGRDTRSGVIADLGSYTSTNVVIASDASFRTTGSTASPAAFATWCGFFGPQGAEAACYFSVTRQENGSSSQRDLFIIGTIAWGR